MRIIAAIGPDELQPWEAFADFVEDEPGTIAILDACRMHDNPQWQPFGIHERVDFASLYLLGCVVTHCVCFTFAFFGPPFSADFSVWLSIMPAVGFSSRPSSWRSIPRNCCQIFSQLPILLEFAENIVDRRAWRKAGFVKSAPGAPRAQHKQNCIHRLAHVRFARPPAWRGGRDQRLQNRPLSIRHAAWRTSRRPLVHCAMFFRPHAESPFRCPGTGESCN